MSRERCSRGIPCVHPTLPSSGCHGSDRDSQHALCHPARLTLPGDPRQSGGARAQNLRCPGIRAKVRTEQRNRALAVDEEFAFIGKVGIDHRHLEGGLRRTGRPVDAHGDRNVSRYRRANEIDRQTDAVGKHHLHAVRAIPVRCQMSERQIIGTVDPLSGRCHLIEDFGFDIRPGLVAE